MTKICTKCGIEKELNNFSKHKTGKYGRRPMCKECIKIEDQKYRENNKDKIKKRSHEYYENNKDKIKIRFNKFKSANKIDINKRHCLYTKKWRNNNKNKVLKYKREYNKKRRKADPSYRLSIVTRSKIAKYLKPGKKDNHSIELLGCSISDLKQYLESQFTPEMSWSNYGSYWQIDHIIGCANYNLSIPKEQYKCFNWRNLRPLQSEINNIKQDVIIPDLIKLYQIEDLLPIGILI